MKFLKFYNPSNMHKYMFLEIGALVWPVVIEMLCLVTGGILTTAMVGSFGAIEVASVGLTMLLQVCMSTIIAAAGIGAGALVARAVGGRKLEEGRYIAGQTLYIGIVASSIASLVCLFGGKYLVSLASPDKEVIELTSSFLDIMAFILPFMSVTSICLSSIRATGKTRVSMFVAILGQILSVSVSYMLLFVFKIGAIGAIIGVSSSQIFAAILSFIFVRWDYTLGVKLKHIFPLKKDIIVRVIRFSMPAAMEQVAIQSGRIGFSLLMATAGAVQYAGHNVAIQIESISFMPGMAFGIAAMTLVGQSLGKGLSHRAREYAWMTCFACSAIMGGIGILFFLFAENLTYFFIQDPKVLEWGVGCVRIAAMEQISLAISMVLPGVLRGAGDTMSAMYVAVFGSWFVRMPLVIGLMTFSSFDVVDGWICAFIDFTVRAILLIYIVRKKEWKKYV